MQLINSGLQISIFVFRIYKRRFPFAVQGILICSLHQQSTSSSSPKLTIPNMKFLILLAVGLAVASAQKGVPPTHTRGVKHLPLAPVLPPQRFVPQLHNQLPIVHNYQPMAPLVQPQRVFHQQAQLPLMEPFHPLPAQLPTLHSYTPLVYQQQQLITPLVNNQRFIPNKPLLGNGQLMQETHQIPYSYTPQQQQMYLPVTQTRFLPHQQQQILVS